jgi:hypothetical protein
MYKEKRPMCRNVLTLVMVLGLASMALGVIADWSEEMTLSPAAKGWLPFEYNWGDTVTVTPEGTWVNTTNEGNIRTNTAANPEDSPLAGVCTWTIEYKVRLLNAFVNPPDQACVPIVVYNGGPDTARSRTFYCNYHGPCWDQDYPEKDNFYLYTMPANEWQVVRVVMSQEAKVHALYVDGALLMQQAASACPETDDPWLCLGASDGGGFNGVEWDYIRVYKGALPPSEPLDPVPPPVTVNPTSLALFENAASGPTSVTYSVVLQQQPTADVTITLDPNDAHVTLAPSNTLTFTAVNWATPQTVTVSVTNSVQTTPSRSQPIKLTASSADLAYNGILLQPLLTIYHDDVPAVLVDSGNGVAVAEQGATSDTYTVQLLKAPSGAVTVTPSPAPVGQVSLTGLPLTFTGLEKKTVSVQAVDDTVFEGDPHYVVISHGLSGAAEYAAAPILPAASVTVSIADNDCGVWGYDTMDFNHDCVVDLRDFAVIAAQWGACTKPYAAGCVNLLP